jgi:phage tail-like protein
MKIRDFRAEADLVGRRVRVSWVLEPDGAEGLADAPRIQVRRKTRDFEFPSVSIADPWVVYDSATFPPAPDATVQVADLPGWETREGAERTVWESVTVARPAAGGRLLEVLRRTDATVYSTADTVLRRRVELLDNGPAAFSLEPGTTYYYQLWSPAFAAHTDPWPYRATATPGDAFGLNRRLYDALPAVYKRHDVVSRTPSPGAETVPEASPAAGQLRRFIDPFGAALDALRGSAENLRTLRNVDGVDHRYLPLLARWLGWRLSYDDVIPIQRNEIKSASRLYRTVGTVPGIRAIVGRYAGWYVQVAEFAQQVLRANDVPAPRLWVTKERAGAWVAPGDAARVLGFDASASLAEGAGTLPATLTGTAAEPFALLQGMALRLSVDGDLPTGVRFADTDFADPRQASAAEVCAAINAAMFELGATVAAGGRLTLTTVKVGPKASLRVVSAVSDLVSVESGSGDRHSALTDPLGRVRLFIPVARAQAGPRFDARPEPDGGSPAATRPYDVRVKTFAADRWSDALATPALGAGSPAATLLPDGRIWLGWIASPGTGESRPRFALGRSADESPAVLAGSEHEPFALVSGSRLRLLGSFAPETLVLQASDFTDPSRASAAEVATAINARLTQVRADVQGGQLRLATVTAGPRSRLAVDLAGSTTARRLGLAGPGQPARGGWDPTLDWGSAATLSGVRPGRHADTAVLTDAQGLVRIFWSQHRQSTWRIVAAAWTDRVAAANPAGLATLRDGTWTTLTTANGLPSNDVRGAAADADGNLWVATAAGAALLRANGSRLVRNLGSGLASNDVRAIALAADGQTFVATGAGLAILPSPGGAALLVDTASGLPGNDLRGLALADDGTAYLATATGACVRDPAGALMQLRAPNALPSDDVRAVALDEDGAVWFATAGGLARRSADGSVRLVGAADGLHNADCRAVAPAPDGALWVATAAGVACRDAAGAWSVHTTAAGLPGNDIRSLMIAPDGSVWAGTDAGIGVRDPRGVWGAWRQSDGLPGGTVRALLGPCSAPRELAAGGAGNREPAACLDDGGRIWLLWSQLQPGDSTRDRWTLRLRRYTPATDLWDAESAVTTQPAGARAADRQPAAIAVPGSGPRVFFRSDRGGSNAIWWLTLSPGGAPSALQALPDEPSCTGAPAPVSVAGELWLLHSSDANLALGELPATGTSGAPVAGSERLAGAGSLRRVAGSTTPVLADRLRNSGRRSWGDLLAYTPQKPGGPREPPLAPDEPIDRGTLGLYVSAGRDGLPLTQKAVDRLEQLLAQFLPINLRAVVILAPSIDLELVYAPGADIAETYFDRYPVADALGPISDSTAVALPQWVVLTSNRADHRAADPANLATLRRRTYWPPPR